LIIGSFAGVLATIAVRSCGAQRVSV